MKIQKSIYYRTQHITGSHHVLVSIKFGKTPSDGILIVKRLTLKQDDTKIQFDLGSYLDEVQSGVKKANVLYGGSLEIQEIEIVPSDRPTLGQVEAAAFKITEHVLENNI